MTFQDIFRSDFLENMASISLLDMVLALSLSFLLGLFLFLVYKKPTRELCIPPVLE